MKKNCYQCEHSEYVGPDYYGNAEGWSCNKRVYKNSHDEYRHLDKMNDPTYLEKGKRCFEKKENLK